MKEKVFFFPHRGLKKIAARDLEKICSSVHLMGRGRIVVWVGQSGCDDIIHGIVARCSTLEGLFYSSSGKKIHPEINRDGKEEIKIELDSGKILKISPCPNCYE